jgi:hypothetical protein
MELGDNGGAARNGGEALMHNLRGTGETLSAAYPA